MKRIIPTGFSTAFFGVSWEFCDSERDYISKLFYFLYGRRVLFTSFENEEPQQVIPSIISIKNYITEILCVFNFCSENKKNLLKMIDICNDALDRTKNIINNQFKPVSCLAEEMLGYGSLEIRSILEPLRHNFYVMIEKLEKKNHICFPNKKMSFYSTQCGDSVENIISNILHNNYSDEVSAYIFELINNRQLINFIEIYKPILFSKLFIQFDTDSQLIIIEYIITNYSDTTGMKMMKKYDIFAFIASQILKENVDSKIKICAQKIIYQSAKTTPSSLELLHFDPVKKYACQTDLK